MDYYISPTTGRRHHRRKVVVIMGPTGCGKSRLSIDLATRFLPLEIINSDKMQVYRGLDITANKILMPDCHGVPHHLLGNVDPSSHHHRDFSPVPLLRHLQHLRPMQASPHRRRLKLIHLRLGREPVRPELGRLQRVSTTTGKESRVRFGGERERKRGRGGGGGQQRSQYAVNRLVVIDHCRCRRMGKKKKRGWGRSRVVGNEVFFFFFSIKNGGL